MPLFDALFTDAQTSLDELYAERLEYRAGGRPIAIMGIVVSHKMGLSADRDVAESWLEDMVECEAGQLLIDGATFLPAAGHEIAKTMPDRSVQAFKVVNGPGGMPFEWIDTDHIRLAIYCKYIRLEPGPQA